MLFYVSCERKVALTVCMCIWFYTRKVFIITSNETSNDEYTNIWWIPITDRMCVYVCARVRQRSHHMFTCLKQKLFSIFISCNFWWIPFRRENSIIMAFDLIWSFFFFFSSNEWNEKISEILVIVTASMVSFFHRSRVQTLTVFPG